MTYALATNGYICLGQAVAAFTGERVKPSSLAVVPEPVITATVQVRPSAPEPYEPEPTPTKPNVCAAVPPESTVVVTVSERAPAPTEPVDPPEPTPTKPIVKVLDPTVKVKKT